MLTDLKFEVPRREADVAVPRFPVVMGTSTGTAPKSTAGLFVMTDVQPVSR